MASGGPVLVPLLYGASPVPPGAAGRPLSQDPQCSVPGIQRLCPPTTESLCVAGFLSDCDFLEMGSLSYF